MIQISPDKNKTPLVVSPSVAFPVLSLFIPFEPKMMAKASIVSTLLQLKKRAELKLRKDFPGSIADSVLQRLEAAIQNLDYSTHKKSVAIYATPKAEKIFYLDFQLEEKVIVQSSYSIRSLVESKIDAKQYLALVLDKQASRLYSSANRKLTCIINKPAVLHHASMEPESFANTYLTQVDNGVSIIHSYYFCPLFVIGASNLLDRYKAVTKNKNYINEFIQCECNNISREEVANIMYPYVIDWKKTKKKDVLQRLYNASENRKLAVGVTDVFSKAMQSRGKLLIVEKGYRFPVVRDDKEEIEPIKKTPSSTVFTDLVDDAIEKVLETGGDVEFAEEGFLNKFMHIVLIHS